MTSSLLMTLAVVVEPPQRIGAVAHGTRVTAPISGGRFEGDAFLNRLLAVGIAEIHADGPRHVIEEIL